MRDIEIELGVLLEEHYDDFFKLLPLSDEIRELIVEYYRLREYYHIQGDFDALEKGNTIMNTLRNNKEY